MAINEETDRTREFEFLKGFVQEGFLGVECCRNQLKALWTAYCIHQNLDVDTAPYDNDIMRLWNTMQDSGCNVSDVWETFEQFDDFLCQDLV